MNLKTFEENETEKFTYNLFKKSTMNRFGTFEEEDNNHEV